MQRLFMLLEFLHGRPQAQPILADMIEEEGDVRLAEAVRARKPSGRKLLQLALEVIPFRMATEIAIDYFEQAILFGNEVRELNTLLVEMRHWVRDFDLDRSDATFELTADDMFRRWNDLVPSSVARQIEGRTPVDAIEHAFVQLTEVLVVTQLLIQAHRESDFARARRCNNRLRTAVVKVAGYARDVPVPLLQRRNPRALRPYSELVRHSSSGQIEWQWNHLIEVIQIAVAEGSDSA